MNRLVSRVLFFGLFSILPSIAFAQLQVHTTYSVVDPKQADSRDWTVLDLSQNPPVLLPVVDKGNAIDLPSLDGTKPVLVILNRKSAGTKATETIRLGTWTPGPTPPGPGPGPQPPGPQPPTPPTPDPVDPPTPAPIPFAGFRVLIVYETMETLTTEQQAILMGKKTRDWLEANCVKEEAGTKAYRIYDKDTDVSEDYPTWQGAMQRVPSDAKLPYMIVSDGKTGFEGSIADMKEADVIAIWQKLASP